MPYRHPRKQYENIEDNDLSHVRVQDASVLDISSAGTRAQICGCSAAFRRTYPPREPAYPLAHCS